MNQKGQKRKDQKGRILAKGESQRKDGRYAYKYIDNTGKPKFLYSWKLNPSDPLPKGKRHCKSLRELEKVLVKDQEDGIDPKGKKMSLCRLYQKQNALRSNVTENTVLGRAYTLKTLNEDSLGSRAIDSIKMSHAKQWAIRMANKGYGFQSISNMKRSLVASFQIAIQDDYARKNPFIWNLADLISDDTKHKEALTEQQITQFLAFVMVTSKHIYLYPLLMLLAYTGLRVSEACGLTLSDIDMENRILNINHQLLKGKKGFYISSPKTESGKREIPITDRLYEVLKAYLKNGYMKTEITVDGYSNFLFSDNGKLPYSSIVNCHVRSIWSKYNKKHKEDPLPKVTPHILRHSFCTMMANKNMYYFNKK